MSNSLWPHGQYPARLFCSWNSPGKNTRVGSHSFLQRIFPTQGLNRGLLQCRQILYCLSHQGSPRILEWALILALKKTPSKIAKNVTKFVAKQSWGSRQSPVQSSSYITIYLLVESKGDQEVKHHPDEFFLGSYSEPSGGGVLFLGLSTTPHLRKMCCI